MKSEVSKLVDAKEAEEASVFACSCLQFGVKGRRRTPAAHWTPRGRQDRHYICNNGGRAFMIGPASVLCTCWEHVHRLIPCFSSCDSMFACWLVCSFDAGGEPIRVLNISRFTSSEPFD